jgi:hypothetical protein
MHVMQALQDRVRRHRDALRQRGLRPIQIWVPDTRTAGFAAEARRQSLAINEAGAQDCDMEWLEDVSLFDEHDATR